MMNYIVGNRLLVSNLEIKLTTNGVLTSDISQKNAETVPTPVIYQPLESTETTLETLESPETTEEIHIQRADHFR